MAIDLQCSSTLGVDIDWDHEYDDWWTDRKGGYDITYDTTDNS